MEILFTYKVSKNQEVLTTHSDNKVVGKWTLSYTAGENSAPTEGDLAIYMKITHASKLLTQSSHFRNLPKHILPTYKNTYDQVSPCSTVCKCKYWNSIKEWLTSSQKSSTMQMSEEGKDREGGSVYKLIWRIPKYVLLNEKTKVQKNYL